MEIKALLNARGIMQRRGINAIIFLFLLLCFSSGDV